MTFGSPEEKKLSPLVQAIKDNDAKKVESLLHGGADIHEIHDKVWTMLEIAAALGHTDAARVLIDQGADVNEAGHADVTPLIKAAWNGCIEMIQLLIDSGAEVDAQDLNGYTALMLSITGCNGTEPVRLLINNFADIYVLNNHAETAYDIAWSYKDLDTIELIEKAPVIQERIRAETEAQEEDKVRAVKISRETAARRQLLIAADATPYSIRRRPQP